MQAVPFSGKSGTRSVCVFSLRFTFLQEKGMFRSELFSLFKRFESCKNCLRIYIFCFSSLIYCGKAKSFYEKDIEKRG